MLRLICLTEDLNLAAQAEILDSNSGILQSTDWSQTETPSTR